MKKILVSLLLVGLSSGLQAQCFFENGKRTKAVTSFYATKGTGKYKNEILWLNWGATDVNATNGINKSLTISDYSNAEIKISDDKYICVETVIKEVSNIYSSKIDTPWSAMDESYSVPANDRFQVLVTPNGQTSSIKLESRAYIYSRSTSTSQFVITPFRLKGLIFVDSESANSSEYMHLTADGEWNIIELMNETNRRSDYKIKKQDVTVNNVTHNKITFGYGIDKQIGPLAMLSFDETAYATTNFNVSYSAQMKGGGLTSVAIGLLTPYADFGDAPQSYGYPIHLIDKIGFDKDNLSNNVEYDLKSYDIKLGNLKTPNSNFIGSLGPFTNSRAVFSVDAMGDDYHYTYNELRNEFVRTELNKEEDGWPKENKNFSYIKMDGASMILKKQLKANIPLTIDRKSILAGWVDFNLNGKFDDSEMVYSIVDYFSINPNISNKINVELKWEIPQNLQNLKVKDTYVRLRLFDYKELFPSNAAFNITKISPTSDTYGGEVEDHKINVIKAAVSNPILLNPANVF